MRNFGIPNVQASLRGGEHPPAHYAPDTQRGSNLLACGLALERSDIAQALIDIFKFILALALVSVTGLGIVVSFFWIFFVEA
jgi:hypothetical protein